MFDYGSLVSKFNFTHLPAAGKTLNLGDDIQVECASRLWGIRNYIERDDFSSWKSDMVVPFFGWYGYDLTNEPPKAECILVSFHLCRDMMNHITKNMQFINWFKYCIRNQGFPAIARDTSTMTFLRNKGIDCEFGGCLTSTLQPYTGVRSGTLAIDVPINIARNCDNIYHQCDTSLPTMMYTERLNLASERIDLISKAEFVHTSKLHIYLPCKALGTPVKFYHYDIFEPHRLSGLIH